MNLLAHLTLVISHCFTSAILLSLFIPRPGVKPVGLCVVLFVMNDDSYISLQDNHRRDIAGTIAARVNFTVINVAEVGLMAPSSRRKQQSSATLTDAAVGRHPLAHCLTSQ